MSGPTPRTLEYTFADDTQTVREVIQPVVAEAAANHGRGTPPAIATLETVSDAGGCQAKTRLEIELETGRIGLSRQFAHFAEAARAGGLHTCSHAHHTEPPAFNPANLSFGGFIPVAAALLLLMLVWTKRPDWRPWQPGIGTTGALRWGAAVGVLCIACGVGLSWLASLVFDDVGELVQQRNAGLATSFGAALAIFSAPIVEEFAFRAWFMTHASRAIGAVAALVVSTLAFIMIHLPDHAVEYLWFALVGIILGLLWLRTRSLLACITAHAMINLWAVAMTWLIGLPQAT
ncbi:MAG: type II CAAX endopeptidase family protein [Lysobacterales bacterium]